MAKRPKLKLELSATDKAVELVAWILLCILWIISIIYYNNLPTIIPTHYNLAGEADGFDNKLMIFSLPLLATLLLTGLTELNRHPHIFNYPTEITAENANKQYTSATRLIRYLKLFIVLIFGLITYKTIRDSKGGSNFLGVWFLPITIGLILIPIIYFVFKSFKKEKIK